MPDTALRLFRTERVWTPAIDATDERDRVIADRLTAMTEERGTGAHAAPARC